MKLISNKPLREFAAVHAEADSPLQSWRGLIERNAFHNFSELKATFAGVYKVGELFVFNIGGNKFRLISGIAFRIQIVYVKHVLTHVQYDKGAWK